MGNYFIGARTLEEAKNIARKSDYVILISTGRFHDKISNKNLYSFVTHYKHKSDIMRRNP